MIFYMILECRIEEDSGELWEFLLGVEGNELFLYYYLVFFYVK